MMNQKNNYQLLSLDMDGTLLNSAKQIPCETTAAIQELMERGVEVVVGTGRGLAELADYRDAFHGMHYGLLVSGGLIYDFQHTGGCATISAIPSLLTRGRAVFRSCFQQEKPLTLHALSLEQCQCLLEAATEEDAMVHILTVHDSVAREQDILSSLA